MNNEYYQTSNMYRSCCQQNRYCNNNQGCNCNNNSNSSYCPSPRPQPSCCPTTITIGTTTTGAPGTPASVTNSGVLGSLLTRDKISILKHCFRTKIYFYS